YQVETEIRYQRKKDRQDDHDDRHPLQRPSQQEDEQQKKEQERQRRQIEGQQPLGDKVRRSQAREDGAEQIRSRDKKQDHARGPRRAENRVLQQLQVELAEKNDHRQRAERPHRGALGRGGQPHQDRAERTADQHC